MNAVGYHTEFLLGMEMGSSVKVKWNQFIVQRDYL